MADYRVLLVERIDPRAIELLRTIAEVVYASAFDEETLIRQANDVDGIIFRARGTASRRLMENAPRLKVVARHGVGVDNIDVEAASELGILVVNTPEANNESVAEHTIGIMLALSKLIVRVDRGLRRGQWRAESEFQGSEVRGKTLGIVGAGRIGTRVAEIAHKGLDMHILYCDVVPNHNIEQWGARRCELDELLRDADYVSLHVPLSSETTHLIGERALSLMKPTAYLLNLSRGQVVDERALIHALQTGQIAGAGLDVFETEPLPPDSPLTTMENVVITPHMASHTREALLAMAMVVSDVIAVLQGHAPRFPVNRPQKRRR